MNEILLIRAPYGDLYTSFKKAAKFQVLLPPTGILYLGAVLEKAGYKVKVLDCELDQLNMEDIKNEVRKSNAEIIGLSSTTPEIENVNKIAAEIKKIKDVKIILGGPHPSILPDDCIKDKNIDFVIRGEGEITIVELINALEKGKSLKNIDGISYKKENKIIHNKERALIENLDEMPFQARHLVQSKCYTYPAPKGVRSVATMLTTRGCPYNCIFCRRIFGKSVRFRSAENVVDELEQVVNSGISFFYFNDDTFILDEKRAIKICDMIIKRKLDINWFGMVRANLATREVLSKMKQAGCDRITMGIESGSQKILDILKKGAKLEQYEKTYRWAKEVGLETRGSLIIGNPYDTVETIKQTINFSKKLAVDEAYFNIMTPYPGTEVYEMAKQKKGIKLLTDDWKEFKRWGNAVIELPTIKREELIKWQKIATRSFYLRPSKILFQLKRMGIKDTIKAGLSYLPSLFR